MFDNEGGLLFDSGYFTRQQFETIYNVRLRYFFIENSYKIDKHIYFYKD
jgi:hypothetical protein